MIRTVIRYACVGLAGTAIHFGTTVFLVEVISWAPPISSVIGFIITVLVSYMLNRSWTFSHITSNRATFLRYIVVSCSGALLTYAIMAATTQILSWHYMIGQILIVTIIPLTNFLLNYYWTFLPKKEE